MELRLELADLKKSGKISDTQTFKFKSDVVLFLSSLCAHLAEKSPVKYPVTRTSRCFIPNLLVESPEVSERRFNNLLENIVSAKQLSRIFAEEAKRDFPIFLSLAKQKETEFLEFDFLEESHRLDTFY